ncbi:ABC transporter ATP-binding protein [Streptacidiphilus sp. PB12-B1b]|uniref:dipeptide ABC transporter ATP-binding protein n=1 Tax=Streptacidiphilus sp. PB12-B1b TaxID=2705012 RepID=UPI0015F7DB91|nr:ABC transporter ATP-binding protein [Streptacidiphilus sp. PB12-B1b]QMU77869.1 ABC transporter ATP-binding protein [Streptacidiphilus sp. PB12-B1b]
MGTSVPTPVLQVEELSIRYPGPGGSHAEDQGAVTALRGLSFDLMPGQVLGLVGESGSGKSAAALALLGLHRGTPARVGGSVRLHRDGLPPLDVNTAGDEELRRVRGSELAMVFQEPLTSLDPYRRVGAQIAAVHRLHYGSDRATARSHAAEALERVGIDPATRYRAYPHEFSGGMRQRALIAMALVLRPRVLVADEPTTALDVTVQAQILDLLDGLRAETGMGLVLISHDLGVVAGIADDVVVLRRGEAVERGPVTAVLGAPEHPYTQDLLAAVPRMDAELTQRQQAAESAESAADEDALLRIEKLTVRYPGGSRGSSSVHALKGVDLTVHLGESLGIVGESGSGKTTLGRTLVRLLEPTEGRVLYQGQDIGAWRGRTLRRSRRDLQMVFQDPTSSLNPRRSLVDSVAEPLRVQGVRDARRLRTEAGELLERVGLGPALHDRYPHQVSGGQRQRAAIARALILRPRLVVCDEPVSALDVTTQAQVVALLAELRADFDLTLVFIAHDLAVVRQVSDRIAVMRQGEVVEILAAADLADATHPYTRALLDAAPVPDPQAAREQRRARTAAA